MMRSRSVTRLVVLMLCAALGTTVVTGCGPRKYTDEELAQQEAAEKRQEAEAKEREEAAAEAKEQAEREAQERREAEAAAAKAKAEAEKEIAYNTEQVEKPIMPDGVHQIGKRFFVADPGFTDEVAAACDGTYTDSTGYEYHNDVKSVTQSKGGGVVVECKGTASYWRDAEWQKAYERSQKIGEPLPGLDR